MSRRVPVNSDVISQFSALAPDGLYPKQSGLTSADWMVTVWCNGVVSAVVPTITEIGTSGEYKVVFHPNAVGFWKVEVAFVSLPMLFSFNFDVLAVQEAPQVVAGQTYHDVLRDYQGNILPFASVNVYLAGTATLVTTVISDINGEFDIPLTGALAGNVLVDLVFVRVGMQTVTRANVRLF